MDNNVKCPKCGSHKVAASPRSTTFQGAAGAIATGGVGFMPGQDNAALQSHYKCMECGKTFRAKQPPIR